MVSLQPKDLFEEVEQARKFVDAFTKNRIEILRFLVGRYWQRGKGPNRPVPENLIYSWINELMPQLVFDNPAVQTAPILQQALEEDAEVTRQWINQWLRTINARQVLQELAMDYCLGYSVALTGAAYRGDWASGRGVQEQDNLEAMQPYLVRIRPADLIIDHQAASLDAVRFIGHSFQRDLAALQNDERYDQDVVKRLAADSRNLSRSRDPMRQRDEPDRQRVLLYQLYLPEHRQIVTLAEQQDQTAVFVRAEAFHGPRRGPYRIGCFLPVDGSPLGLSPCSAMYEAFLEHNAHVAAAAREAASAKSLTVVDSDERQLAERVAQASANGLLPIKGANPNSVFRLEIGGTSESRMAYIENRQRALDRVISSSDFSRGQTTGVTATEIQSVQDAIAANQSLIVANWREFVAEALSAVGWWFWHEESMATYLTIQPKVGPAYDAQVQGGPRPGMEQHAWEDSVGLDLEPYSMRRVSQEERSQQAQLIYQLALQLGPLMPQMPWINWQAILSDIGRANDMPDLPSRLLSLQGMAMMGMMMPGMVAPGMPMGMMPMPGMAPPAGAPAGPTPMGGPQPAQQPPVAIGPA